MRIVANVPMKLNNSRLPQKNIKKFRNGEPLCRYILDTLLKVDMIDEIYVYCSDERICEYLPDGVSYLKRTEEFDKDTVTMNEILSAFHNEVRADIYVMTHTTAPFISTEKIYEGIRAVVEEGFDSSLAVTKIQDFMWKDGIPMNYDLKSIPRTQDLDPIYMETSGFYIYTKEVIEQLHRRIGNKPYLVEVNRIEAIDIDEYEDFQIAEAVFNYINCFFK